MGTVIVLYLVIVLFFVRYAYFNPDGDCWNQIGTRHVSDINDGESINVATVFHNWFIDFLLLLLFPPLFVIFCAIMVFGFGDYVRETCLPRGPEDAKKFFVTNGLVFLAFNLWVVFWGYYARYGEPGMACSGDYY